MKLKARQCRQPQLAYPVFTFTKIYMTLDRSCQTMIKPGWSRRHFLIKLLILQFLDISSRIITHRSSFHLQAVITNYPSLFFCDIFIIFPSLRHLFPSVYCFSSRESFRACPFVDGVILVLDYSKMHFLLLTQVGADVMKWKYFIKVFQMHFAKYYLQR